MPLRCLYEAYHHQRQPSIPQPWLAWLVRGTPHLRCAALSHLCTCLTLSNQAARLLRKHHKRQRLSGAGEGSPECSSELPQVGCSAQHSTAQHSTAQHSTCRAPHASHLSVNCSGKIKSNNSFWQALQACNVLHRAYNSCFKQAASAVTMPV